MSRAQSYRTANSFNRSTSRRSRQMAHDVMKSAIVLSLVVIGYFSFAPDVASSAQNNVVVVKK